MKVAYLVLPCLVAGHSSPCPGLVSSSKAVLALSDEGQDCVLEGGCDGEYVCLGATAGCASGVCCLSGSSDPRPLRRALREPKWI